MQSGDPSSSSDISKKQDIAIQSKKKWRQRHRFLWVISLIFASLIGLIIVVVAGAIIFVNTQKGQNYIASKIGDLTNHSVEVSGLSGGFPNHLRLAHIELKDTQHKTWLELKDLRLDWSVLALLGKTVRVDQLSAKEINVYFLPSSSAEEPAPATSGSSVPNIGVGVNIAKIQVDRLFVSHKVVPQDITIGINGKVAIRNVTQLINFQSINDITNVNLQLHVWELNHATDLQLITVIDNHTIDDASLAIHIKKQDDGIVERILQNDQLTPLSLNMHLKGPYDHLNTDIQLSADQMQLAVNGFVDLLKSTMNIALNGHSPAMTVAPKIRWGGWNLNAKIHGNFKSPAGNGKFELTDLAAGDAMVNKLILNFKGQDVVSTTDQHTKFNPWVNVNLLLDGIRIPGAKPKLLAESPLSLDLMYYPKEKDEPVDIKLSHDLLHVAGRVFIMPSAHGKIDVVLPNLSKLSALGGVDVQGKTSLNIAFALPEKTKQPIQLDVDGPVSLTGGLPQAAQLIGKEGHLAIHAQLIQGKEQDITLKELRVQGKNIALNAVASLRGDKVGGILNLDIKSLSALSPMIGGTASAKLGVSGTLQDMNTQLNLLTVFNAAAKSGLSLRPSKLELKVAIQHLPTLPQAHIALVGELDKAPLNMQMQAGIDQDKQNYYLKLQKISWRSLEALADVNISPKTMLPIGKVELNIKNLSDFGKLVNQKLDGMINLDIHTLMQGQPKVIVDLNSKIMVPQAKIGHLTLDGSINNPIVKPSVDLKLQADQLQAPQIKGKAIVTAKGGMDDLKITAQGNFPSLLDAKGNLDTALTLDLVKQQVSIQKLSALVKGENIRLLSPVKANFGKEMGVDRLRMSVAPSGATAATIDVAGTIQPKLSVTASIHNITPALAKPFAPDLKAQGVINVDAKVNGSLQKPQGMVKLTAQNMKLLAGPAASLPAAQLNAQANLNGNNAHINTHLQVGNKVDAVVQGTAPLQADGNIALNLNGKVDLAVANAIVGVSGQQVQGNINMAMQVNGKVTSPVITGNITLENGSFHDYSQGVTINNMQASIIGQRDSVVLQSFTAKAGKGTMNANGQIGIFQPGIPITFHFGMKDAQPLSSDLLTARLDGDVNVKGMAKTRIDVSGVVKIKRAEINIPHSVASSVVQLKVIRPGDKVQDTSKASSEGPIIGLDLNIKSAGQILVRGFGLFTDMAGSLHVGGTADAPQISGGFNMQNGHIDMAGISLDFTKGQIGFKGSGVDRAIDPTLDFEVKKEVEGTTVKLEITGYASSPKIALTSSPPISQDRVLAMLLFGVDSQNLSTTQMAEIGVALATLGGEGAGIDPLGVVRKTLGLDRLSIGGGGGSSANGGSTSGASIAAGKYIAKGVYLGAKQSTGGGGTQAEVQVDITKHLKATATVGTGKDTTGFITPDNDPGSSVGLLYQFKY